MVDLRILHFLADGRVGGPQVRIVRVHEAMHERLGLPVETIVACPAAQPAGHFARPGMRHVEMAWNKPTAERPLRSGVAWLFSGIRKDVVSCRKIMRDFPGALVHVNGAILLAAALAAILEKRSWLWHLNDTSVPRLLAILVRAMLAAGTGKVIAASKAVVAYYRLPETTEVVYPPVEALDGHDKFTLNASPARLGVMANLSPGKGIEHVIEAFAIAHRKNPDMRLLIAGRILDNKRWYFESLRRLAKQHGVDNKVEFCGFVAEPLQWIRNLDLFLFSSHAEAAGLALIEAMACGLPVVSAEIPATREILGGCGVLTPLGDANAMAEAVCTLMADDETRRSLSRRAAERGRSVFSADVIAQQYRRIYSGMSEGGA